jgi:hypothetical protein
MNISRRTALQGAAGIIILPALGSVDSAEAFDLGGIGASLLQGLGGFVNNAASAVTGLVQQGANLAANAVQLAAPSLTTLAPVVSAATQFLLPNGPPTQAAPIYVNPYQQPRNFSLWSQTSSRPWQLSDSDEQFLRGDPYGYISQNAGTLGDFIIRSQRAFLPQTYRALAAQPVTGGPPIPAWGVAPYAFQGQAQSGSFYPSVTSSSGSLNLSSLIQNVAALAPLISMFLA